MSDKSPFKGFDSLSELGEFGFIDQVAALFGTENNYGETGIGDDCAVLPYGEGTSLLVTTDMLIEDRHFRREWISPEDLGYKSLAVNLSDISAMGGKPLYAFLSIGLSDDLSVSWIEKFFRGTQELTQLHDVQLMGGDTTKSPGPVVINYTIIGVMQTDSILWRSGAKPGDHIAVLGNPGESGAGLKLLLDGAPADGEDEQKLISAHHRPQLYVEEAQFLASFGGVNSMIDLSDGIESDARHIAQKSGITLQMKVDQIPISPTLQRVCDTRSWDPLELAVASGEDYGLLFTAGGEKIDHLQQEFHQKFGYSFITIGEVTEGPAELQWMKNGEMVDVGKKGFDHFKSEK
ncbi:thiamine-phosphate kinase [Rhodohalobacter sp. SW132]|uniref:thiamine-phosphate kinase n=1 Tax=Rhodohalobacter sp. SW132 TaxID=2293433 RepID=UPI001314CA5A|nr:thiamine-phosphate kinase [Rhodohalobacter sp. SW132]